MMIETDPSGQLRCLVTSAEDGVQLEELEITPDALGLKSDIRWSITKRTLRGGKQQGVGLITIDNGTLQIDVIESRGLSILDVRQGDWRLGWNSPVKEVVHPAWINLESRGGLGWLEGFNEFVARCGLESAGAPGPDRFVTNTGAEATVNLTLHGRIGNLPASELEVVVQRDPPHQITLRGHVHERQMFGPQLQLTAEVVTTPGSSSFEVIDRVTNHRSTEQEFELIYHCNYGPPLLEKDAVFHMPVKSVTPINSHSAAGLPDYATFLPPTSGFTEEVYLIEPHTNGSGETLALLRNATANRGASIRWRTDALPYFSLWKNTDSESNGYVTGLEPGTCFPFNRSVERKAGRLPTIGPNESRQFKLEFSIHDTNEQVAAVRQEIESIQADQEILLVGDPPE